MITMITGRAGAGKTELIMARALAAADAGEKAILIVPEQFSFSAEQILARRSRAGGLLGVQVLSPSRLSHWVLSRAGGARFRRLDAAGAAMAARRALAECAGELRYFARAGGAEGMAALTADMISSLKQSDMSPEAVEALAARRGGRLADKLFDIAAIYRKYCEDTDPEWADSARQEALLAEAIGRADFLGEYEVWVDGFDVISPLTLRMLAELAGAVRALTVTFACGEPGCRDAALFRPVEEAMRRLEALSAERGIPTRRQALPRGELVCPEIAHIERELYAYPPRAFAGEPRAITVLRGLDPDAEADAAAVEIIRLAREEGYAYGDIAAVSADESRAEALWRALTLRGARARLDATSPASSHSAVIMLCSAVRCAVSGMMRREDVLRVVKSGWCGLSDDEADIFENYIIENGLFGSRFARSAHDPAAERMRALVAAPLVELTAELRTADTARACAEAVYAYLERCGLLRRLTEAGEGGLAEKLCAVLDQSWALLGRVEPRLYCSALSEALASVQLGEIPHLRDSVQIGSVSRFKGDSVRALVVLGLNEGVLPSGQPPDSLLTPFERSQAGAYLGAGGEEFLAVERLSIYGALTQARERLILCYSRRGADGAALLPSPLLRRFERMFPGLAARPEADMLTARRALTDPGSARRLLPLMLRRSPDPEWGQALSWLEERDPIYADRVRAWLGYSSSPEPLPAPLAADAFGGASSVSRLETYARCPYSHFVQYGLLPVPRREPELMSVDTGSFYHDALEQFTRALLSAPGGLSPDEAAQVMDEVTLAAADALRDTPAGRTPQGEATIRLLRIRARRAASALAHHLAAGRFSPLDAEIAFGRGAPLPALDVGQLSLRGRIDRLDTAELPGGARLGRIIDYKSGSLKLSWAGVWSGAQLQLVTYMNAIRPQYTPVGAFYLHILGSTTHLGAGERADEAKLLRAMRRGYRLEGVCSSAPEALDMMRGDADDPSDIYNISLGRDGAPAPGGALVTPGQLSALMDFTARREAALAADMLSGSIAANPLCLGSRSACTFCDARAACPYEAGLGAGPRRVALSEADAKQLVLQPDAAQTTQPAQTTEPAPDGHSQEA